LKNRSDWYLSEIQSELQDLTGVEVSISTVWRSLKRAGASWKLVCLIKAFTHQVTKHARERREDERAQFRLDVIGFSSDMFVNLDESAVDRKKSSRSHGYSLRGRRANVKSFFVRGKRFTIAFGWIVSDKRWENSCLLRIGQVGMLLYGCVG
jgi:hypothetical protein